MATGVRPLTPKRLRFVQEFLVDLNGTQAAIRAGYSPRTADVQAARLLGNVQVQAVLAQRGGKVAQKLDISVEKLCAEYAALGFADMAHYLKFDSGGNVYLDWSAMPEGATKAISEITQEEYLDGKGANARLVRKTRFKLHNKVAALDSLAARLWPVVQKSEHTGAGGGPIQLDIRLEAQRHAERLGLPPEAVGEIVQEYQHLLSSGKASGRENARRSDTDGG